MNETSPAPLDGSISLSGPAFFDDPYPLYARIAANAGPVFDCASNAWLVGRYADANSLLRDARISNQLIRKFATPFEEAVLFRDPPDHGRVRATLNHAFTSGAMDGLDRRILGIADGLIEGMLKARSADFLSSFAVPLPVAVISELLGIPPEEREQVHEWSSDMMTKDGVPKPEGTMRQYRAILAMEGCIRRAIAEKKPEVESGLIGALLRPAPGGERLTEDELVGNCILLLVAGHETTVNLLGNGLYLLLQRPELVEAVRADPRLLTSFVEEVLRYESPVQQGALRVTTEAIEVGGVRIGPGETMRVLIGAANRDPAVFAEADRFDPSRTPNPHLAFGLGPHRCVGAMLARMEARIAFSRLLERLPMLRLQAEPVRGGWLDGVRRVLGRTDRESTPKWHHNVETRGLRKLEITY